MRLCLAFLFFIMSTVAFPAFAADVFSDVPASNPYAAAIMDLKAKDIMHGYSDGSFHPDQWLNRAEFTAVVMQAEVDPKNELCAGRSRSPFGDVPVTSWFFRSVCGAKLKGIVEGYDDKTFKPDEPISFAQASKIIAVAFGQKLTAGSSPWYKSSIFYLSDHHAIPLALGNPQQYVTRGELAEILWRLKENKQDEDSLTADDVLGSACAWEKQDAPPNVDMQEVERTWLGWINGVRAQEGLSAYLYDKQLERTALVWSQRARQRGSISHKRHGQTLYYDYPRIEQWFADEGLTFQNDHRMTFSESIGYGRYVCAKSDCTQALIDAIRTTFDFYLAEKGKENSPHWNSILNPRFRMVGVGVAVDEAAHTYYITTHYATSITSNPSPVCP